MNARSVVYATRHPARAVNCAAHACARVACALLNAARALPSFAAAFIHNACATIRYVGTYP
ncbi:MAG: hypothetical protein IPF95_15605 [Flavobacteriales bacterium]|nr:hypothetical protein [Flavobacteriales bacterium]MBK6945430.1 hypothetical protein [Flavobacteriales bacterium]